MILSMTGFGAGVARFGDEEVRVEIRAVNHKYCEVKARLPPDYAPLEVELARQIKERVRRGAAEVFVRRSAVGHASAAPRVDLELAREYVAALDDAAQKLSLARNLGIAELAAVDGMVVFEARTLDLDAARAAMAQATAKALDALIAMRQREGVALAQDVLARVKMLREGAARVKVLQPKSIEAWRARLEERIAELTRGIQLDPQRLAQEVALFADRVDIAEELTRLDSHLEQLEAMVNGEEPTGRRLDFLVQEINREVNTTGSKSQSAEIAQIVVGMKAEIERIREQIQNVE